MITALPALMGTPLSRGADYEHNYLAVDLACSDGSVLAHAQTSPSTRELLCTGQECLCWLADGA